MIKVFESFDFSRVGQMQSLLESNGIKTYLKNQYGSSVMGEVPFIEVIPQLFIIEEKDLVRTKELLLLDLPVESPSADWDCAQCGTRLEGNFDRCWNCGTSLAEVSP